MKGRLCKWPLTHAHSKDCGVDGQPGEALTPWERVADDRGDGEGDDVQPDAAQVQQVNEDASDYSAGGVGDAHDGDEEGSLVSGHAFQ